MAAVALVLVRVKACVVPFAVVTVEADVDGVRSVCIQWRNVCGLVVDGISRSTMITAYEVPVSCDVVAIVGSLAVAKRIWCQSIAITN